MRGSAPAHPRDGTVNLRSCGRSANRISLIRHTQAGESRRRIGENRPRIAQVDSAVPRAWIRCNRCAKSEMFCPYLFAFVGRGLVCGGVANVYTSTRPS